MKRSVVIVIGIIAAVFACADHDLDENFGPAETDESLFMQATALEGFQYYREGNVFPPAAPSPHSSFRLKFNEIAWEALDEDGELPAGTAFPEGSLIVKEVVQSGIVGLYAVMKKRSADANAAEGWLWAEYKPEGGLGYSIQKQGIGCTSCHGGKPHRDFVRTFDLH